MEKYKDRPSKRKKSIAKKIGAAISILIGFITIIVFLYFPYRLKETRLNDLKEKAKSISEITSFSVASALIFEDDASVFEALQSVEQVKDVVYIVVLDENKEVVASINLEDAEKLDYLKSRNNNHISSDGLYYKFMVHVFSAGLEVGELYIGFSLAEIRKDIQQNRLAIGVFSLVLLIAGIFVAFFVSNFFTHPLLHMNETMKRIITGDLTQRAEVKSNDEIGELARTFNYMVANLKLVNEKLSKFNEILEKSVKERTEQLEEARTKAEQANVAKSHFLANMSHELRTPLNAILGISKMLKKYETYNLTEKQKEGLGLIHQSGTRLLTLINDVLDLSKAESGKMKVDYTRFSLTHLISDVNTIFNNHKREKKLDFIIEKSSGLPDYFFSDFEKLHQILVNILGNAVKFTHEGRIVFKIYVKGQRLYFEVKDTGIGISKENIENIFHEFSQIDSSASRRYGGTGLGLSICKKIINLLKGEIEVESELNKGTLVKFYIPLIVDETPSETVKMENNEFKDNTKNGQKDIKILIAEDEDVGIVTVRMMLEHRYNLIFAKDGKETVEKYFSEKPDLVLMDIMMPELNGFEAFDKIKESAAAKKVPVIALTARAMKYEKEEILDYGFDDYISKPIDDELLCKTIEKYLKK